MHIHFALIFHWGGGRLNSSCITLSSRCLSNSHLSFANLCSMSPDISHSSCSCSPFVFQCAKVDFLFCFVFSLYQIVAFSLGEATVHLQIGCFCRLADCFVFFWTMKILLLSWRNGNPCSEKKIIISYCLLEKLLAYTCRWPAKDLKKKNWILSSFFLVLRWSKLA